MLFHISLAHRAFAILKKPLVNAFLVEDVHTKQSFKVELLRVLLHLLNVTTCLGLHAALEVVLVVLHADYAFFLVWVSIFTGIAELRQLVDVLLAQLVLSLLMKVRNRKSVVLSLILDRPTDLLTPVRSVVDLLSDSVMLSCMIETLLLVVNLLLLANDSNTIVKSPGKALEILVVLPGVIHSIDGISHILELLPPQISSLALWNDAFLS